MVWKFYYLSVDSASQSYYTIEVSMLYSIKNTLILAGVLSFTSTSTIQEPVIQPIPEEEVELEYVLTNNDQQQIRCLAENIYHEARGEPELGQVAVTNVVLNRVEDSRFPSNACSVIKQRNRRGCQFSWVCQGKKITNCAQYNESLEIAREVYVGEVDDVTNGAQFYHATYVRPSWSRVFQRTTRIGLHIFYRI